MARVILQNQVYGVNDGDNYTEKKNADVAVIEGAAITVTQIVQKEEESGGFVEVTLDGNGYFTAGDKFRYVITVGSEIGDNIDDIQIVDAIPSFFVFDQSAIKYSIFNKENNNLVEGDLEFTMGTPTKNDIEKYTEITMPLAVLTKGQYIEIYIPVMVPKSETEKPTFGPADVTNLTPEPEPEPSPEPEPEPTP